MDRPRRQRARRASAVVPVALLAAEAPRASDAAADRLTWVVLGLVVLATVIAIMTIWFWRATRPEPAPDPEVAMRWLQPPSEAPQPVGPPAEPRLARGEGLARRDGADARAGQAMPRAGGPDGADGRNGPVAASAGPDRAAR